MLMGLSFLRNVELVLLLLSKEKNDLYKDSYPAALEFMPQLNLPVNQKNKISAWL